MTDPSSESLIIPVGFTNRLTKWIGEPLSGEVIAGGTKGMVISDDSTLAQSLKFIYAQSLRYAKLDFFPLSTVLKFGFNRFISNNDNKRYLDQIKGTCYVELILFTAKSQPGSQATLSITNVEPVGISLQKNVSEISQDKISFEMNRSQDWFDYEKKNLDLKYFLLLEFVIFEFRNLIEGKHAAVRETMMLIMRALEKRKNIPSNLKRSGMLLVIAVMTVMIYNFFPVQYLAMFMVLMVSLYFLNK